MTDWEQGKVIEALSYFDNIQCLLEKILKELKREPEVITAEAPVVSVSLTADDLHALGSRK